MSNIIDALSPLPVDLKNSFDENESTDLALHVRQCTRRYDIMIQSMVVTKRMMWVLILMAAAQLLHL